MWRIVEPCSEDLKGANLPVCGCCSERGVRGVRGVLERSEQAQLAIPGFLYIVAL
jgi:hypothetical protein